MQLDFFLTQPEEEKDLDYVDISQIKYPMVFFRTWDYCDIPEGKYFLYKTGGTCFLTPELGNTLPKLVNNRTGVVLTAHMEVGSDAGYMYWSFPTSNKTVKIKCHRLVAEAFLQNDDPYYFKIVDHINRNSHDFRLSNIRWLSFSQNTLNSEKGKRKQEITEYKNFIKDKE
jgi:hypothetical protein